MAVETAADLAIFFDTGDGGWGEAATYTPPTGAAVACTVVVDRGVQLQDAETGEVIDGADVLYVRRSEVDDPLREGTFATTVAGETWRVNQVMGRDENVVKMHVRED